MTWEHKWKATAEGRISEKLPSYQGIFFYLKTKLNESKDGEEILLLLLLGVSNYCLISYYYIKGCFFSVSPFLDKKRT